MGIGTALTKKLNGDGHLVYTLHGDGELQEGQIWEAVMFAAHHKVDNLIATVDYNGQQIDGGLEDVMSLGDLAGKWKAFGWLVLEMNGHDFDDLRSTLAEAKCLQAGFCCNPTTTDMGHGVDFMSGTHEWHGKAPNDDQLEVALGQLEETLRIREGSFAH